ncbi:DUF3817 domain-containing protein [Actinoplanes sp. NPDC049265]|uniref:DUF3817 domain-containing protein n=1 Tax=Actinoplanes sp. NPDC049265 TaxID=3363902 RepID=UPI0037191955
MSLLRAAAIADLVTLVVLLTNLATVHIPQVASLMGPIHGCAYLLVIGATWHLTRSGRATVLAAIPIIGAARTILRSGR